MRESEFPELPQCDTVVWSLRNFCITWELFRQINFTVKLFTKEVVFTEIFQKKKVIQKFRKLHSVITEIPFHIILSKIS